MKNLIQVAIDSPAAAGAGTLAKSISTGISPVKGFVTDDEVMMPIFPGHHTNTYRCNLLDMTLA